MGESDKGFTRWFACVCVRMELGVLGFDAFALTDEELVDVAQRFAAVVPAGGFTPYDRARMVDAFGRAGARMLDDIATVDGVLRVLRTGRAQDAR